MSAVVVGRGVARVTTLAVGKTGVAEGSITPVIGVVAGRALPTVVSLRFVCAVACCAIGGIYDSMVKNRLTPSIRCVTGSAITSVMVDWDNILVTDYALGRRFCILLRYMASSTLY